MEQPPVLLMVQGRLKLGGEEMYAKYIAGTGPLMAKYGASVAHVGAGLESEVATSTWPVNAVLSFPDQAAAEGFLTDPGYLEIKTAYRDEAYEELHLSLVQSRPAVNSGPDPVEVAKQAFNHLATGLGTGDWEPWLGMLSPDFSFYFPAGKYQGLNQGKGVAEEFFPYVSTVYPSGLFIDEIMRITSHENTVVFEFKDSGVMRGEPYKNRVAISLDVEGEQITGYREYFGIVGPPPEEKP